MRERISAVVLAAGLSSRMGRSKMILPWGKTTVIGQVVSVLQEGQVGEIVVVTGGERQAVEAALSGQPVRSVYNPEFSNGKMLVSLKVGLADLSDQVEAALVVLGDQPAIQESVVQAMVERYWEQKPCLMVPSYQMHRGHPWLICRALWGEILSMDSETFTMRDFLIRHANEISYLDVDTATILQDLDTPQDYENQRPKE